MSWIERMRSVAGAFLGLMLVFTIAKFPGDLSGIGEWPMASLGGSALLVFALPSSPMAQPWAVIAGNTISTLIGISCFHLIGEPLLALPMAVGLSILGIFILLPPSTGSCRSHNCGFSPNWALSLCFFPVMVDSILLILAGALYSDLTGKSYPNRP